RNVSRIEKPLIAHAVERGADIHVFKATSWQQTDPHLSLAEQVKALVRETNDPSQIIVLGRTYAQLNELEAVFLSQKIPYRVVGRKPFFERREIQVLLDYVRLAMRLEEPVARQTQNLLLSVANTPNRKIGRDALTRALASAYQRQESTKDALKFLAESPMSPLGKTQCKSVTDLLQSLERIRAVLKMGNQHEQTAGVFLDGLVKMLNYLKHFDDYYGQGEHSEERKQAVLTFCRFADKSNMGIHALMQVVNKLDTTQGAPEEHQIVMTSVFRTKGLEYDYVIIPNCINDFMPCQLGSDNKTYDKAGLVKVPVASAHIESERRLFYVALTRARKAVFIGATSIPGPPRGRESPPVASCFLDEMALEPTREVMNALQACAAGKPGAETVMLAALKKIHGVRNVAVNLATHYIKSLKGKQFKKLIKKIRILITKNVTTPPASPPTQMLREGRRRIKIETSIPEEKPWWR
ncbi:MAG: ATP-dependent helicase, partial [Desulfovibrionales bacterium]